MRILLVDDDEQMTELLKATLVKQHYVVDTAPDGQEGWELVESINYDLVLLDVMLPKLDGISFCRQLRAKGNQVPVLLLTARDTSNDKIMGLDAGADDYVVKPVVLQELAARIRSLLRRGGNSASPVLEWGNLSLDPSSCKVTYGSYPLHLTPKEYALLELFLRNSQRVYSRAAILDQLWSFEEPPGEDTVKAHIKGLRQKLKAVGATDFIETVYGLGYHLNQAFFKPTPLGSGPSPASLEASQKAQQTKVIVNKIWQTAKTGILQRVATLDKGTQELVADPKNDQARQLARQEAHKLAGSLGTFGLASGSQLARQIEELLEIDRELNLAQIESLQTLAIALRQVVEEKIQQVSNTPAEPAVSNGAARRSKKQESPLLLMIDDDQELADLLVAEASQWGLRTAIAPNPQVARTLIARTPPDVILLDLSFAQASEDGLTLLAELANRTPPPPVLVFTGSGQFIDRVAVARLKGRGFLQKPASPTQVLDAVTQVLKHKAAEARILVVDDDPLILEALPAILQPWGLQVATLDTPLQFWNQLEATGPDLLILDVDMPDINGIELCQTLRNDPQWGWLPVIFLTARTDSDTIHQVFAAGADDYVSKPIVAPALVTRIMNRLERTRMLRRQAETDTLTGTANRQRSLQDLNKFLQLAKRSQQSLCLGVLQLDCLQQVNQQYGYHLGDQVLRQVGQLLQQKLRPEDVVSRWGGAEFVVGMYGMTRRDGVEWLAEILETLRQETLTEADRITFSAGVAQYPDDGPELSTLHQSAIAALEQAKATGGDRILPTGWKPLDFETSPIRDVVLVHPEADFAHSVLQALHTRGYHSQWLPDGNAALQALAGIHPTLRAQVILLPEDLRDTDGLSVLKQLVRDKVTRHSRVVMLLKQASTAESCLKLGAFDYILPPWNVVVLLQRLRRSLEV